jgi:adenylate kinase
MNIALLGPSGSGKGTHAVRLINEFNFVRISTGDLFHHNVENHTVLGIVARKYIDRGDLVPDEVADAMVEEWLTNVPSGAGLLFDGFPRTVEQAKFLDATFRGQKRKLDAVVYLKVTDEVAIRRLEGRMVCVKCSAPFNVESRLPGQTDICDFCGGDLFHRPDDRTALVGARLRSFHRAAGPVLEHYQKAGKLLLVPADGAPDEVYLKLVEALRSTGKEGFATRQQVKALQPAPPQTLKPEEVSHPALNLVLLGGPGCGKGTQAEHLCREFGIPTISTGELFRKNIKDGTELGRMAKTYMDRGELVPDAVTEGMVERRLELPDTGNGFVLDGFPRTLPQAQALDESLTRMGRRLSGAISIEVSDDESIERLAGRRICPACRVSYHVTFKPPKVAGKCDGCGGNLIQRDDDNPATIRARLKTFHAQILPLADYYQQRRNLIKVMGEGEPAKIKEQILKAAKSLMPK